MNEILITRYLAGECSEEERNQVQAWLNASPLNKQEYQKIQKIWNASAMFTPDAASAYKKVEDKINGERKINWFQHSYYRVAAALLIGLLAATYFLVNHNSTDNWQMVSASNEKKNFILPDGSSVWLNKNSSLRYDITNTGDRICQLKGEAFFEVQKMKDRPFTVEAEYTSVRVVGTSFNIESNPQKGQDIVSVMSGKVKFSEKKERHNEILLSKDEASVFTPKDPVLKIKKLNKNALAWKTGVLQFNNNSLNEVAKELEKQYSIKINVDKSIGDCTINATFNNLTIQDILIIIQRTLKIEYTMTKNKIHLKGRGC